MVSVAEEVEVEVVAAAAAAAEDGKEQTRAAEDRTPEAAERERVEK